jgi:four helix bundle protein
MLAFRQLAVWEKAHELTLRVHRATEGAAMHRSPGLSAQLRRSITAIPTNIAEGTGHPSQAQFNRFLEIALASASEADYQLLLAKDLDLISAKEYAQLEARLSEVRAMLIGLRKRVVERARESRVVSPKAVRKNAG